MISISAQTIAEALGATRRGDGWVALCPAHDDKKTPNLHINEGNDGTPLFKCFAGCSQEAVIESFRGFGIWPEKRKYNAFFIRSDTQSTPKEIAQGVTLTEYATAKCLGVEFLKSQDVTNTTYGNKPAVRIATQLNNDLRSFFTPL